MSNNNVNDITNQLILKYDDKFNQLYDENLNINSSIMNKEELIVKINMYYNFGLLPLYAVLLYLKYLKY